jgi:hypothetical protein
MTAKQYLPVTLIASSCLAGWWLCTEAASPVVGQTLVGDPVEFVGDGDEDFLPDAVEWVVLTSASSSDTDGDRSPDFVEVVQHGAPRDPAVTAPDDHEMRVVVTAPRGGDSQSTTWMHLMFRFMGSPVLMTNFGVSIRVPFYPNVEIPLTSLAAGNVVLRQRDAGSRGVWIHVAVPMASEAVLRAILPCTIRATATIGGRSIRTGVLLFDCDGTTSSLVPFDQDRFAVQSISSEQFANSGSNKVCLLSFEESGGVATCNGAECEDSNDLQCSRGCPDSVGWVIDLPSLQSITGG